MVIMSSGIFDLNTPKDLLTKLKHDYQLIEEQPNNSYLAFNFFVTAESMLDWIFPGHANKKNREKLRKVEILLQITSHIASGAKHFSSLSAHHKSVNDTNTTKGYFSNYFPKYYFPSDYFGGGVLIVQLDGDAKKEIGDNIVVLDLAKRVLDYWEKSALIN